MPSFLSWNRLYTPTTHVSSTTRGPRMPESEASDSGEHKQYRQNQDKSHRRRYPRVHHTGVCGEVEQRVDHSEHTYVCAVSRTAYAIFTTFRRHALKTTKRRGRRTVKRSQCPTTMHVVGGSEYVIGGYDRWLDHEPREVEDGESSDCLHPVDHLYTGPTVKEEIKPRLRDRGRVVTVCSGWVSFSAYLVKYA